MSSLWTRRLQTPLFQRPGGTSTLPDPVVIDMATLEASMQRHAAASNTPTQTSKSPSDTLFGPPVGLTSATADWTTATAQVKDAASLNVTPELVKEWAKKAKETPTKPVATTTLQSLVNLKRPSIRLTPLALDPVSEDQAQQPPPSMVAHGLEFNFDCDAAKCNISIHALLPKTDTYPGNTTSSTITPEKLTPALMFEHIVEGGFGRSLSHEDGAMLELSKLLSAAHPSAASASRSQTDLLHSSIMLTPPPAAHIDGSSSRPVSTQLNPESGTGQTLTPPNVMPHGRKRFSGFHFRKKHSHGGGREVVGPALQVVDADAEPTRDDVNRNSLDHDHDEESPNGDATVVGVPSSGQENSDKEEGIKVTITLEALDEEDHPLSTKNSQVTYLHIIRMVPQSTTVQDPSSSLSNQVDDDTRPWVVKVVKREAVIGPHTFRLQEIYGLTASSSTSTEPAAPTYPPQPVQQNSSFEAPASECLVCLSSPREVVLLPCRHLVACRECAVNMVEFGAGGALTHELSATATTAETGNAGDANTNEGGANTTEGAEGNNPTPAPTRRRKRKAKGWFCPICRQPYTSLLRITTHAAAKVISDDEDEVEDVPQSAPATANSDTQNTGTNTTATSQAAPQLNRTGSGLGGMMRSLLPGAGNERTTVETRA